MSPAMVRAARAWFGWTQPEFAKMAGIGVATLKDFERGSRVPMPNNLKAMRAAIEAAGMTLLFDGETPVGLTLTEDTGAAS